MFKVILASFFGLAAFAAEALAAGGYYCQSCGNPYTASGRQLCTQSGLGIKSGEDPLQRNRGSR